MCIFCDKNVVVQGLSSVLNKLVSNQTIIIYGLIPLLLRMDPIWVSTKRPIQM